MGNKRRREKARESKEDISVEQKAQGRTFATQNKKYKQQLLGETDVVDNIAFRSKTDAETISSLYDGPLIQEQLRKQSLAPPRPNYFAAMQVSQSTELVEAISQMQSHMCKQDVRLKSTFVEPVTAHFTLALFCLPTEEDVDRLQQLVVTFQQKLKDENLLGSFTVHMAGIDSFDNKVLYIRISENERILKIVNALQEHFKEGGICMEDREFTAHITIAKVSKARRKGPKKIKSTVFEKFKDIDCGHVAISTLQFCNMQGRKADEYYPILSQIQLDPQ